MVKNETIQYNGNKYRVVFSKIGRKHDVLFTVKDSYGRLANAGKAKSKEEAMKAIKRELRFV